MNHVTLEDVRQYLPESAQEIALIIGVENLERFIKEFGGTTFKFSKGRNFTHLKNVIGEESAEKIQKFFANEEVYIPLCQTALRVLRNYRIKADFIYYTQKQGLSGRKSMLHLAPKYQLSNRTLWEIIKNTR
jgi:hypothetical protein